MTAKVMKKKKKKKKQTKILKDGCLLGACLGSGRCKWCFKDDCDRLDRFGTAGLMAALMKVMSLILANKV
jgi:hypothetical protein